MEEFYDPEASEDGVPTYRIPETLLDEIALAAALDRFGDIPIFE